MDYDQRRSPLLCRDLLVEKLYNLRFKYTIFRYLQNLLEFIIIKEEGHTNIFCRFLSTVYTINAKFYLINGDSLKLFMPSISSSAKDSDDVNFQIRGYTINDEATALLMETNYSSTVL